MAVAEQEKFAIDKRPALRPRRQRPAQTIHRQHRRYGHTIDTNDPLPHAHRLRRHGANVEELSSRVESAPFAGTPLFLLDAVVTLPKGTPLRKLRDDLDAMGDALGWDVDLDPA